MRTSIRRWVIAVICSFPACWSSFAAAQQSDQLVAERVLGPQWKQLSRRAGMIFVGTVLSTGVRTGTTPPVTTQQAAEGVVPVIQLSFRVDHAIAGVESGQVLTIHEWAGAWSMHRPMSKGQHILIFLYPPSRLGLTSPVGGLLGQIAVDPSGKNVSTHGQKPTAPVVLQDDVPARLRVLSNTDNVSFVQLERAIRSARQE